MVRIDKIIANRTFILLLYIVHFTYIGIHFRKETILFRIRSNYFIFLKPIIWSFFLYFKYNIINNNNLLFYKNG